MSKSKNAEIWRTCAVEEFDRMQLWTRLMESFVEYQKGCDSAIGIGMRRLSEIMANTVRRPELREAMLEEITTWAMANMWRSHVEVSNAYADVYHLKRIKNLASSMVKTVAELEELKGE